MRADVIALQAVPRVRPHQLVLDGRQGGGVGGVHRRDLAAGEDVVVDRVQRIDRRLHLRRQLGVGVAHAGEAGPAAFPRHLVGMGDGDEGGHLPEGGIGVPHLVAALVAGAGVRAVLLAAVVGDVADGAEPDHLSGLAEGDVLRLRLAQPAGEREMGLVGHRLAGKAEEGVRVDRLPDRLHVFIGQLRRQVQAGDPGAERGVQRFGVEVAHAVSPRPGPDMRTSTKDCIEVGFRFRETCPRFDRGNDRLCLSATFDLVQQSGMCDGPSLHAFSLDLP